jgi:hypothetical protein
MPALSLLAPKRTDKIEFRDFCKTGNESFASLLSSNSKTCFAGVVKMHPTRSSWCPVSA